MSPAKLVERLRTIPDSARTWACDERVARLEFGLDERRLRQLVAAGLPTVTDAAGLRFEWGDLHYVGLRLRCASTFVWAAQQWARSLALFACRPVTQVTLEYVPQLPVGVGAITGIASLPDGERRAVVLESGHTATETQLCMCGEWPALPPEAAAVVDELACSVELYLLPAALQRDTQRVRETGLSDCMTAAHVLVERWRAAGLDGRVVAGLLVSVPYSTLHVWPEVRAGEAWLPADPLMLQLMREVGGLEPAAWPTHSCVGPMVWAIEGRPDALLTSAAGPVETTFITSVEPT
jgi:hypothetical protein